MNNKDVSNIIRIQGTNDNSILSKCSMIKYGYFNDDFLPHMIGKFSRRAPLINRGYYIRAKAIEYILLNFIDYCDKKPFQIVSLGAGFDTSFFRLTKQGKLANCTFIEIDYFDVAQRKATLMKQEPRLWNCLTNPECVSLKQDSYIFIDACNYKLIGIDLTKLDVLDACIRASGASYSAPTLFLSECVLTYISTKNSTNLLRFLARSFPDNAFVLYEQIHPDDSFGRFMCNHFKQLGSSLRGIATYKNQTDQINRFLNAGWNRVGGCDMARFYYEITNSSEKRRIESLEVFDEYEEWLLKCNHYMLLVAVKGLSWNPGLSGCTADSDQTRDKEDVPMATTGTSLWLEMRSYGLVQQQGDTGTELHRAGGVKTHYARAEIIETESGREFLMRASGYGQNPFSTGHCRLSSVSLLDLAGDGRMAHVVPARHEMLLHSLCGSMVRVATNTFLLFGGRSSPLKPNNCATELRLHFDETEQCWQADCQELVVSDQSEGPSPRWRHLAAVYWIQDRARMLVYGGRNADPFPLSDLHVLDWTNHSWTNQGVPASTPHAAEGPGPLCSAAVVSLGNGDCVNSVPDRCCGCCCVLAFGGMSGGDLLPSNALWRWCGRSGQWTRIGTSEEMEMETESRIAPRFSHSLHLLSQPGCHPGGGGRQGDSVITVVSVGGVSHECPVCPVTVIAIDIDTNTVVGPVRNHPVQVAAPPADTEPECVMLHNHGSAISRRNRRVWIVGGGGNCFSFGTQLNENIYSIDLSDESLFL